MRTVIVDEGLRDLLVGQNVAGGFSLGLLVGRQLPQYHLLLSSVPCCNQGRPVASFNEITKAELEDQATKITNVLVGGMKICGVYCVSTESSRRILDLLQRFVPGLTSDNPLSHSVHVNMQTSQISCRIITFQGHEESVDLKVQSIKLQPYTASLRVKLKMPAPVLSEALDLETVLLQNIDALTQGMAIKTGSRDLGPLHASVVRFYTHLSPSMSGELSSGDAHASGYYMQIRGEVLLVAYVHERETDGDAIVALKEDLTRSLTYRIRLLKDRYDHEKTTVDILHAVADGSVVQLPRRVLAVWKQVGDLIVTLHLLQHESMKGGLDRVKAILSTSDILEVAGYENESKASSTGKVEQDMHVSKVVPMRIDLLSGQDGSSRRRGNTLITSAALLGGGITLILFVMYIVANRKVYE